MLLFIYRSGLESAGVKRENAGNELRDCRREPNLNEPFWLTFGIQPAPDARYTWSGCLVGRCDVGKNALDAQRRGEIYYLFASDPEFRFDDSHGMPPDLGGVIYRVKDKTNADLLIELYAEKYGEKGIGLVARPASDFNTRAFIDLAEHLSRLEEIVCNLGSEYHPCNDRIEAMAICAKRLSELKELVAAGGTLEDSDKRKDSQDGAEKVFFLRLTIGSRSEELYFYALRDSEDARLASRICKLFERKYSLSTLGIDEWEQPHFDYCLENELDPDAAFLVKEEMATFKEAGRGDTLENAQRSFTNILSLSLGRKMMGSLCYQQARIWHKQLQQASAVSDMSEEYLRARMAKGQSDEGRSPRPEEIPEMPPEERQNSALIALMWFAQAYYKMLECTIAQAGGCAALDLELNQSYLWVVQNVKNLLKNKEVFSDFSIEFQPLLPDLYPQTIRDLEWDEMVAPEAERFLSTVQQYAHSKGIHDPEKGSSSWVFAEMLRPSIKSVIEEAEAYAKRMREQIQELFRAADHGSPAMSCREDSEGGIPLEDRHDKDASETPVKLGEFIKRYCKSVSNSDRMSLTQELQRRARHKKIELPFHVGEWKSGQAKYYLPSDLKEKWSAYRKQFPRLPELEK